MPEVDTSPPVKSPGRTTKTLPGRIDISEDWPLYHRALTALEDAGVPFAIGGAFALGVYTNHFRDTKDLDLYIVPSDRDRAIEALTLCGLVDIYDTAPYDRHWIYRSAEDDVIVDIIWRFANYVADVDADWLQCGVEMDMGSHLVRIIPPEELLWAKLYILQRTRCDWTDLLNLLYGACPRLDWKRLIARLGRDKLLLAGLLSVFAWLCPGRATKIPVWVWDEMGVDPRLDGENIDLDMERVALLDSRPWFFAAA